MNGSLNVNITKRVRTRKLSTGLAVKQLRYVLNYRDPLSGQRRQEFVETMKAADSSRIQPSAMASTVGEGALGEMKQRHTRYPRAAPIACGTPIVAVLGSSRLDHVLVQGEVETMAVRADGSIAWRAAHDEVVTEAELVGGRLVTVGFDGRARALDPATGRSLGS